MPLSGKNSLSGTLQERLNLIKEEDQKELLQKLTSDLIEEFNDTYTEVLRWILDLDEDIVHLKEGGYAEVNELLGRFDFKAKINFMPMQDGDVIATASNTDSLKEWVGFSPSTTLKTGIKKFAKWFLEYKEY